MTNYSLWEVIINGDSLVPIVVAEGAVQPAAILSIDQKLAKRNELKARGTLLMALLDKHQLKFNSHKDAKTLIEAIKKCFGGNTKTKKVQKTLLKQQFEKFTGNLEEHSLDDLFNSLRIYEAEVKHSSSPGNPTQNIAFVSSSNTDSTTDSVSAATGVSALDNEDLKQIDVDDLKEMDLRWQMAMLNMRARRSQPSGEYHVVPPPITGNFLPLKPDLVFHTALIAVETAHSAFTIQLSPAKPAQDISHTSKHVKPSGHSAQPVEAPILDTTPNPTSLKNNVSSKRKNRKTCVYRGVDHLIKDCNFHAKPKTQPTPRIYTYRGYDKQYASSTKKYPKKHIVPAAVLTKSKPVSVTAARPVSAAIPKIMETKPKHARSLNTKSNLIIRRHKIHSQSSKTSNSFLKVTATQAQVDKGVIDSGCSRHMIGNMSYLSDFQELNGGYVAFGGNPKGGKISSKGKLKTGKLDFEDVYFVKELKFNLFSVLQMCDKKNKDLFTDSECLVLSLDFKLHDENQVLLRVPRENNMYNVNLKNIVPSGDLTCLFPKATIDESNLWHRSLRKVDKGFIVGYYMNNKAFRVFNCQTRIVQETLHVNFLENKPNVAGTGPTWLFDIDSLTRTMNYQPVTTGNQSNPSVGFQEEFDAGKTGKEANQWYMLFPVWSTCSTNLQNKGDATFDGKEHDAKKPESRINLSPSSSALSGEQDDLTNKKDKGKSLVDYFIGNRDFNVDFKDYSKDSSNDVSVAGPIVHAGGQSYSNSINPFSATGPSNINTCPTHRKSLLQDASQPPDMLESEDIVYSDHKNVGAEVDFNNLETSITVSPIPTTRIHNAYPEPKRVHQALKDPSWTEAMQEELLQNKKDERGIVVRNKARFIAQGHTQEEGIDLQRTIKEEVYVCQPLGFEDPDHPDKVYKVVKVKQKEDGIFINQDKYVAEILKKFGLTEGKSASTPIDTENPLLKDSDGEDVDVHIYISMISSLMYLTLSRLDIMFAIDKDDMEEMDIKWNMALLSMRADKFWKRTGKKISIQGSDVAGFDKSKVECFNCHKMGHFARECRAPRNQERVSKESYRQGSKAEEKTSKALMAIDGVGWDWSYMANEEDHALVADGETPTEFALMANNENKVFDNSLCSKECRKNTESVKNKIDELKNDLYEANIYRHSYKLGIDQLEGRLAEYKEREVKYIETIRTLEMDKEYNLRKIKKLTSEVETLQEEKDVVNGKLASLLKSSKDLENIIENLSWTGLPEFVDDTVTDYSRPSPTVPSTSSEDQNKDTSTSEEVASTNPSKPFVKFVKPKDSQPESKLKEQETPKKPQVKHFEQNRQPNGAHMRPPLRSSGPRTHGNSMRPPFRPASHKPHGPSMNPRRPTMNSARPYKTFFQTPSFETRPFLKSSAVKNSYRAPWVPTVNRIVPPIKRKFSTVEVVTTAKQITEVIAAVSETVSVVVVVQAAVPAALTETVNAAAVMTTAAPNTARFRLDYFKGMSYDDIRPIFEANFNANMEFLLKSKEQMEEK
nr:ribonuclease H-like domain-containing protein [Tanacetum cinerariifolium]